MVGLCLLSFFGVHQVQAVVDAYHSHLVDLGRGGDHDHIVDIRGAGVDAELFASYLASFQEREAYAVSHVGWGMNEAARWDTMALWDKGDINGTEQRAFAGNFLYSTGANEVAGRFCRGHFDLPMRNCTIALDGQEVVRAGVLHPQLRAGGPS